jgi:hypothetical protein
VLNIGEKEYRQPVEVLRDPHTAGSDEDIRLQYAFGREIFQSIQSVLHMIDTLEILRSRALAAGPALTSRRQKEKLAAWRRQLLDVEALLHDVHATGARQDIFRSPAQLLERFLTISKESISGGSDWRPTDQHREVYSLLSGRLAAAKTKYEAVLKTYPLPKAGGVLPKERVDKRTGKD